jgi:hypothetical protein
VRTKVFLQTLGRRPCTRRSFRGDTYRLILSDQEPFLLWGLSSTLSYELLWEELAQKIDDVYSLKQDVSGQRFGKRARRMAQDCFLKGELSSTTHDKIALQSA